jgi:hypothetical protein
MAGMVHRPETHSPRPVQGWRDFLKEIGTIVIGVAIALAAGEAVDGWNWQREVAIVKDSLDDELSDAVFAARERVKIANCQRRTLDRLDELADQSRGTLLHRASPVSRNRVWGSAAWEAAVASGAVAHMSHDERNRYAMLFSFVQMFRELNLRQQELWARIEAYRRPRAMTPEARDRFVETVSELRSLTSTMNLAARQFLAQAEPLGIRLSREDAATLDAPLQCPMP